MDVKSKFNAGDDAIFIDSNIAHKYKVERVEAMQTQAGDNQVSNVFSYKGEELKKDDDQCFRTFEELKEFLQNECDYQDPSMIEKEDCKDDSWERMSQNANQI